MKTMTYEEARPLIQTLDIINWSGLGVFSSVIKIGTGKDLEVPDIEIPTHVAIALVAHGRVFVIESWDGTGVRIFPLSKRMPFYYLKTPINRPHISVDGNDLFDPCAHFNINQALSEAFKHVGDEYSWFGCIKAFLNIPTKKDDNWQCAEFVNHILTTAGLQLPRNAETPVDVVNEIYKLNGGKIIYVTK